MFRTPRILSVAGLIAGGLLLVQPLCAGSGYMIIFKNGRQLETKAPPVIRMTDKGAKAYFMTVNGQEFVVKAEQINLSKSASYNADLQRFASSANDINTDDEPANQSLGRAAVDHQREANQSHERATVVTTRDLSRTSGNELNTIDPIAATGGNSSTPEAAPSVPATATVATPNGPATINYTITVPQPPTAPTPAGDSTPR